MERFLSARGRAARWPSAGILQQATDAKTCALNATIGIALDDEGVPLSLDAISRKVALPPSKLFPYAPGFGLPELRKAWKEQLERKNPSLRGVAFSTPVVTAGLTHALRIAFELFAEKEVLVPAPFWGNYQLIAEQVGATLRTFPLFDGEKLNLQELRDSLISGGKRVVLLNFPHNPTGYAPTLQEAEEIVKILKEAAERSPLVVIVDDAYFGLVYEEGVLKESLFARLARLHENLLVVKVDGASKEEYAWGLRVGFLTFGGKGVVEQDFRVFEAKVAGLVRASVSSAPRLSQQLVLEALRDSHHDEEKAAKYHLLKERYDAVKSVLESAKYESFFTPLPFNSGYFLCLRLADSLDAEKVRRGLLKEGVGVIALPGNLLRVAYSSVPEGKMEGLFKTIAYAILGK